MLYKVRGCQLTETVRQIEYYHVKPSSREVKRCKFWYGYLNFLILIKIIFAFDPISFALSLFFTFESRVSVLSHETARRTDGDSRARREDGEI